MKTAKTKATQNYKIHKYKLGSAYCFKILDENGQLIKEEIGYCKAGLRDFYIDLAIHDYEIQKVESRIEQKKNIKPEREKGLKWIVTENKSGNIVLYVLSDKAGDQFMRSGYEYQTERLGENLSALYHDDRAVYRTSRWEDNELKIGINEFLDVEEVLNHRNDNVIADGTKDRYTVYIDAMGRWGRLCFGI